MDNITINSKDKILIIAPHPDDECIGAGGIITTFASQCDVWLLSDGGLGNTDGNVEQTVSVRKEEFIAEMKYSKVNSYKMFNLKDGLLTQYEHFLDSNKELANYTKIFIPNKDDKNVDHVAAFNMLINGLVSQNIRDVEIFQYEVTTPLTRISHCLDITAFIEKKMKLILFHKSQMEILDYCAAAMSLNAYRAFTNRYRDSYIEAYTLYEITTTSGGENEASSAPDLVKHIQKLKMYVDFYDKWVGLFNEKKSVKKFFLDNNYRRIAIYGYGKIGKRLLKELQCPEISVLYVIDQSDFKDSKIRIEKPVANLEIVDIIVVTAIYNYHSIKEYLHNLGYTNVMSIEEILNLL